ncbi:MAG: PhzF family phenazine biosynthesis protein [Phycisphaeraceae bacterium]|nr:PhzF family phenazine biosynthesis protein [Phycisphaeraceae bacterium]
MFLRFFQIDAFAQKPFEGNPAAVVLLEQPAGTDWCLKVAAEMNLSETAFVEPPDASDTRPLRWFTPTTEVDLCGHATLAAAHALGEVEAFGPDRPARFQTRSGLLEARRAGGGIELTFPTSPAGRADRPADLAEAIGIEPEDCFAAGGDLVAVLESAAAIQKLKPDLVRLSRWNFRGVCVTAAGTDDGADYLCRFFAPASGIDEDPVTGSCACYLGPYWAGRLGRDTLRGRQCSPRGGRMDVRVDGHEVRIAGEAVTVLSGSLVA